MVSPASAVSLRQQLREQLVDEAHGFMVDHFRGTTHWQIDMAYKLAASFLPVVEAAVSAARAETAERIEYLELALINRVLGVGADRGA